MSGIGGGGRRQVASLAFRHVCHACRIRMLSRSTMLVVWVTATSVQCRVEMRTEDGPPRCTSAECIVFGGGPAECRAVQDNWRVNGLRSSARATDYPERSVAAAAATAAAAAAARTCIDDEIF